MKRIAWFIAALICFSWAKAEEPKIYMKQIRTYAQYTYPVDPARIFWFSDMDLSYGLASTLVQWDQQKQIAGSLASEWKKTGEGFYRFTLRSNLKWSDGSAVQSIEVQRSFERAFKAYPEDLRSLINMLDSIECPDSRTIEFRLRKDARNANLLGKLTEPQYGVVSVNSDNKIDLSRTTGAFFAKSISPDQILLKRNSNWFAFSDAVADEVLVRKPENEYDHQRVLLKDSWANIAQTYSLMPAELMKQYEQGNFSIWTRPMDKVYLLAPSKSLAANGLQGVLHFLDQNLDRKRMSANLSGFKTADQVFPYGYHLHDPEYKSSTKHAALPNEFKKRPIQILCPGAKSDAVHVRNMVAAIKDAVGIEPDLQIIPLDQASARKMKGDFDIYMGSFGLADPDPEGFMSYYFEGETAVIPPSRENFVKSLDSARKEKDDKLKLRMMRAILTDAKNKGFIMPLFHMSTIGFGRENIDLSQIPETDESIPYAKVRFKGQDMK